MLFMLSIFTCSLATSSSNHSRMILIFHRQLCCDIQSCPVHGAVKSVFYPVKRRSTSSDNVSSLFPWRSGCSVRPHRLLPITHLFIFWLIPSSYRSVSIDEPLYSPPATIWFHDFFSICCLSPSSLHGLHIHSIGRAPTINFVMAVKSSIRGVQI
jgi:hypothetical protein